MSMSQASVVHKHQITPPSSFAEHPWTPPPTDEKPFAQAYRVVAFFKDIRAGKHTKQDPWREFRLASGEYSEIQRQLDQDEALAQYVKSKIRYDYDATHNRLVVRMPTAIHELFIARVEDAIHTQLKRIGEESSRAASFARKIYPARSTEIFLPIEDSGLSKRSKYEPDASFWHKDAEYPGIIFEVAYSQKKKQLGRLAENYLLDSDANVQAVIGLDIEYGKKGSRKATFSIWRTQVFSENDGGGRELRVVQEAADKAFRDEDGSPTGHADLRLRLRDFAHNGLVYNEMENEDRELVISGQQLREFLIAAEVKVQQRGSLSKDALAPGVKKRKRSITPPEEITYEDEAKYIEQEERAAKRTERNDLDYENVN